MGERRVDFFSMRAEKACARSARLVVDGVCGLRLGGLPRRFPWKAFDQGTGERPEDRVAAPVFAERSGRLRLGRDPVVDRRRRQAAVAQGCAKRLTVQGRRAGRRHVLTLKSMTRLALPCDRSVVPGGTSSRPGPHADIRLDAMLGVASRPEGANLVDAGLFDRLDMIGRPHGVLLSRRYAELPVPMTVLA